MLMKSELKALVMASLIGGGPRGDDDLEYAADFAEKIIAKANSVSQNPAPSVPTIGSLTEGEFRTYGSPDGFLWHPGIEMWVRHTGPCMNCGWQPGDRIGEPLAKGITQEQYEGRKRRENVMRYRYVVHGPCYADGWWYVDDSTSNYPELMRKWFLHRAPARAFAQKMNRRRKR